MKSISVGCNLSQVYTNHSVRATTISLWSDAAIPDHHVTFLSGHSNKKSLAHYNSLPSGPQLRKFSDTISNALGNGSSTRAESSSTTTLISPSKTTAPAVPALTGTMTSNSMAVNTSPSMNTFPSGFFSSCNIANVQVPATTVGVIKKELDDWKRKIDSSAVELALSSLQMVTLRPAALFDLYTAIAASAELDEVVNVTKDKKDDRATRFEILLRQCRRLIKSPVFR
ncbi:AP-2 complex subunit sigma [Desmophyllum pertusum]|uniref:AP-2 complex subunit sigma n=1 Tax=Desmophyllum pertusum TaxID=174260 RepID=A0A9X0CK71_9CNID|nr:AP-2 complex subunit sigma [Desmophyllum pertusum]